MHEISQFSVKWPQTCCPVSYYRSPASTLGQQWKQLIITSPTPPQKLISLLPQYYHITWAGPGWAWRWKPGYWFHWQQQQTACSSHVLAQLGHGASAHGKSIEDCSLVVFSQNSWNEPKRPHWRVGSSSYGQTLIGLVAFIISKNMKSAQKPLFTLNPWLFVTASLRSRLIYLFFCGAAVAAQQQDAAEQSHTFTCFQACATCVFLCWCQRQITQSGSKWEPPMPSIIFDGAYQTSFKYLVILEGKILATGLRAAIAAELLSAAVTFTVAAHTPKAALQETRIIDAKRLLITSDV